MSADTDLRYALIEELYATGDMPRKAAEQYADIVLKVIKDWVAEVYTVKVAGPECGPPCTAKS